MYVSFSLNEAPCLLLAHSHLAIRRRLVSGLGCLTEGSSILIVVLSFLAITLLACKAIVGEGWGDAGGALTISRDGTIFCHYFSKATVRAGLA